jgi:hypothetical protein
MQVTMKEKNMCMLKHRKFITSYQWHECWNNFDEDEFRW